ncbi:MAG: hypothetical protein QF681_08220 [Vicinamibacterales bacterium]|jgi:hypothetical protein|nr:hypothetical protein [Vicinamibacterales bacterium]
MIGLAEILIVAVLVGLILVSRRRGGPPARERHARAGTEITVRVPRYTGTLIGAVVAAVAVAVGAIWYELPPAVGTVAAGLVAGIVAAGLATFASRRG